MSVICLRCGIAISPECVVEPGQVNYRVLRFYFPDGTSMEGPDAD